MPSKTTKFATSFSSDIAKCLRDEKRTLKDIGQMIGCSESFMSLVARGKRNFTVDHLIALEKAIDKPLPLLILEASKSSVPASMKSQYESLKKIFGSSRKLRASLSG
jgi:transcriptional regulator with XRE-family HTH domain